MSKDILAKDRQTVLDRQQLLEWFTGNFDKDAIIQVRMNLGRQYLFFIEPGILPAGCVPNPGIFSCFRWATTLDRNKNLIGLFVGLDPSTWTVGIFDTRRVILTTSRLVQLISIETFTQEVT